MARIIEAVEEHALDKLPAGHAAASTHRRRDLPEPPARVGAIVGAKFLVAFTETGDSARRLARYRSPIPLLAFTPTPAVRSQLALTLGRRDLPGARGRRTPTRWCSRSTWRCWTSAACEEGDPVVIVAGSPPGLPGSTNALRVHRMGDAVHLRGPGLPRLRRRAPARVPLRRARRRAARRGRAHPRR